MTSEHLWFHSVASSLTYEASCADDANAMYNRRREQVKRAQRNHRSRQKAYIKSMEDQVLRLQKKHAAVLQEKKLASEENLILKDILKRQPLLLSSSAGTEDAPVDSNMTPRQAVEGSQRLEALTIASKDHFQTMVNTFQLSTLACAETIQPSSNVIALVTRNTQRNEDSEAFDVLQTIATSRQNEQEYFQVQHGAADKDENSSSFPPNMSHSHTATPGTEHCMDLDPYLTSNEFVLAVEQSFPHIGQDDRYHTETPEYYDIAHITPLGDSVFRPPSDN